MAWLVGVGLTAPVVVQAEARFLLVNLDPPGEGLNDPTPVSPVGGNAGRTLGEQRRLAMQHAADLWGAALHSDVDIRVDVSFEPLDCTANGSVLGAASTTSAVSNLRAPGANPDWAYPAALANRLAGEDLDPDASDILAQFNTLEPSRCPGTGGWYYGLDGKPPGANQADLVLVALHELGHGLGITQLLDQQDGSLLAGAPDPVVAQSLDTTTGQSLSALPATGRVAALTAAHKLVWTGSQANTLAATLLASATPVLSTSPPIAGLSGLVADANFGARPLQRSVSGPLVIGDPLGGERPPSGSVDGAIMLYEPNVLPSDLASELARRGAAALLVVVPGAYDAPPSPLELPAPRSSDIPVLSLTVADGQALVDARAQGPVTVSVGERSDQPMGTDEGGRLRLNAATPLQTSVFGHWDTSLRPNQLMEPFTAPRDDPHALALARAWLLDIGWRGSCGDGQLDPDEGCDAGSGNSDTAPDACRSDCIPARCGDGVTDTGERCDGPPQDPDQRCADDCSQLLCSDGSPASGALACSDPSEPPAPASDAGVDKPLACTACTDGCAAPCPTDAGRRLPTVGEPPSPGGPDGGTTRSPQGRDDSRDGRDGGEAVTDADDELAGTSCQCSVVGGVPVRRGDWTWLPYASGVPIAGWVLSRRRRRRRRRSLSRPVQGRARSRA